MVEHYTLTKEQAEIYDSERTRTQEEYWGMFEDILRETGHEDWLPGDLNHPGWTEDEPTLDMLCIHHPGRPGPLAEGYIIDYYSGDWTIKPWQPKC